MTVITKPVALKSVPAVPGDGHVEALMKLVWREALNGLLGAGTEVKAAVRQADIAAVCAAQRFGGAGSTCLNGMALPDMIEQLGFTPGIRVGIIYYGRFRTGVATETFPEQGLVHVQWDDKPDEDDDLENDVPLSRCVRVL